MLQQAAGLSYRDAMYLGTEIDLEPLRSDPAFTEVVEAVRTGGM